jgi:recombinational DNA repair protein RecT
MSEVQTVAAEVAKVSAPATLVRELEPEFGKVLPAHVGEARFTRWALTCLRDPKLCQPVTTSAGKHYPAILDTDKGRLSVMSALMDCASLGLEPGRTYHLAPFKGEVSGIVDWKGEIELISRASPHVSVVAQLVREHDLFAMTAVNVPPQFAPAGGDWFAGVEARGKVAGGFAYAETDGRCSMVVRMTEEEFLRHKAIGGPVWDEWPEAMRVKTLVHQLRKFVPWSAEKAGA